MEEIDGRIVILILFVVISAIKWLIEKMRGNDRQHDISESLEDIYEEFRDEIHQRQTTVQQPAEHQPPTQPQPIQSPPPLPQTPPPVQHTQATDQPYQIPTLNKPELSTEEKAALARFQQRSSGKQRRAKSPQASVRDMLADPLATRKAVILKEILGKPRSLQQT